MANEYSMEDINYQDITHAQAGGQPMTDIVNALGKQLMTGGYFGTPYTSSGDLAGQNLYDLTSEHAGEGQGYGGWGEEYSQGFSGLDDLIEQFELSFGEGVIDDPSDVQQGWQSLLSLLKGTKIPSLTSEYSQSTGDVGSEISSQLQSLFKERTLAGKGGRYGKIATGGKNLTTSGRGEYLADYYDLQDKRYEMQSDLQGNLESDFMTNITNWMSMNPSSV